MSQAGAGDLTVSDDWVPASHTGSALSAQQLRRRLWPWTRGGPGSVDTEGVSYDAAASMSYAGFLSESESGPVGGGGGSGSGGGMTTNGVIASEVKR